MTTETTALPEKKRGPGRPKARVTKKDRIPVGGLRDILTVQGKDPRFNYRWVLDSEASGAKIHKYLQAGYDFVKADDVQVGQTHVFESDQYGSIVRQSNGKQGDYLFLMRIPREWWLEDQKAKQDRVDESEDDLYRQTDRDGFYGSLKID